MAQTRAAGQTGFDRRPAGDRRPNGQANQFNANRRQENWNNNGNTYNKWTQNNNYGGHDHHDDWWGSSGWWAPMAWSGVTGFLGGMAGGALVGAFHDEPHYTSYANGGGGDTIIVNGQSEPAVAYAQEATAIADNYAPLSQQVAALPVETGTPATSAEAQARIAADWMPLGIYAITEENSTAEPNRYVQLVMSKSGAIGGELHDLSKDTSAPIQGAIDPNSKRVAWKIEGTDTTMETGLYNLTQAETPILVHEGVANTKQLMMARIEDPNASSSL